MAMLVGWVILGRIQRCGEGGRGKWREVSWGVTEGVGRKRREREEEKSGEELYVRAMEEFDFVGEEEGFRLLGRAGEKGDKEAGWVSEVVREGGEKERLKRVFAERECGAGWYWAGKLSARGSEEQHEYYRKSSEAGYSWGQERYADVIREDKKLYVALLEKAAAQNCPFALFELCFWYKHVEGEDSEKARRYNFRAAQMGLKHAMEEAGKAFYRDRDLPQAAFWSSSGNGYFLFWKILREAFNGWRSGRTADLGFDFNALAMELGKGLYWYKYMTYDWIDLKDSEKEFGERCMEYYCSEVELQQKTVLLFMHFWNKTTCVKGIGKIIGQMAWEGRYDYLVKEFGEDE